MTSAEFSLWLAMYRRAPWDDTRMDFGFGQVCAALANYAGKTRKEGAAPVSPMDYMPFLNKPPVEDEEPDPMEFFRRLR